MNAVEVKTDFGVIRISEEMDELHITIDSKDHLEDIYVDCLNAGVPGVIGPDVVFSVGGHIDEICSEALEEASRGDDLRVKGDDFPRPVPGEQRGQRPITSAKADGVVIGGKVVKKDYLTVKRQNRVHFT